MADFRYSSVDSTGGSVLGSVPLRDVRYTRLLCGCGALTARMRLRNPKALPYYLKPGQREITVHRDGLPDWNGPITHVRCNTTTGDLELLAREAHWYLWHRTIETNRKYVNADLYTIVRDLVAIGLSKTGGGLYSFLTGAGLSGQTKTWSFAGHPHRFVGDTIQDLSADPTTGFDFRLSLADAGRQQVVRTFEMGSPSLGVPASGRVLERPGLVEVTMDEDLERAANRVHVLGGKRRSVTMQNATSLAAGDNLIEAVWDRSDVSSLGVLTSLATEYRRLAIPPVRTYTAAFRPTAALPFDVVDLGDTITLRESVGYLQVDAIQRVVGIETIPGKGRGELRRLTFNNPLSELGA